MRNIIALLMIAASVGIFFGFIEPTYTTLGVLKAQSDENTITLGQASEIQEKLTKYQAQIKAFNPDDIARLNKFLPDRIDNVNLIIDINDIAAEYGITIKGIDIKQNSPSAQGSAADNGLYDSLSFSFMVTASYDNFLQFLNGLEHSLHLVDVTSISFSPSGKGEQYDFKITLKTYWLK